MTDNTLTGAGRIYAKGYRRGFVAGAAALLAAIEKAPTSPPDAVDPTACTECNDPFCEGCEGRAEDEA